MSGRARLPAGAPRKASQRNARPAAPKTLRTGRNMASGRSGALEGLRSGVFRRDTEDNEHVEIVIAKRFLSRSDLASEPGMQEAKNEVRRSWDCDGRPSFSISGQPALSQAPSPQPSPRIEMPATYSTAAPQATTGAAEPTQPRYHRARRKRKMPATHVDRSHVDRSAANAFTSQLNRQVLESLQSGGAVAPAGNPPYPAPAYPPR